jgi:PAS domain-containing protein
MTKRWRLGAFLLARAYRRTAASEQVLQATLDSVREGVAAFDDRGRLRAWNDPLIMMIGIAASEIRRGAPLPTASSSLRRRCGQQAGQPWWKNREAGRLC